MKKFFTLLTLLSLSLSTSLIAAVIVTDDFSGNTDGWAKASGSGTVSEVGNELEIEHDTIGFKTYNSLTAGATYTVDFDLRTDGGWEDSGGSQDFFIIFVNGAQVSSDSYVNGSYHYSFEADADASGNLRLDLSVVTTGGSEHAYIDDVVIDDTSSGGGAAGGGVITDYCNAPDATILPATDVATKDVRPFRRILLNDINGDCMNYANIKGGLIQIGNQTLCDPDDTDNNYCKDPGAGVQNNSVGDLHLADYDENASLGVSAAAAATTSNSTMAELNLKTGDTVIWAKVYWSGRVSDSDEADYADVKDVKFLTPDTGGAYQDVECTHFGYSDSGNHNYYCSAEVTQYVTQSGDYWLGNIVSEEGASGYYGAWALLVVYQNDLDVFTNVSIYEGFDDFYNSSLDIDVSGFLTPAKGDINATFHVFSGESDDGYDDEVRIADGSGTLHLLKNPVGDNDDFLNASIARYGTVNKSRVPDYDNSLGIDIDSVIVEDTTGTLIMDQNQSSTKIRFTSDGDRLYIPVVALTTELYEPKFCYDYAYSQYGRYFTEENNGSDTVFPHISGDVTTGTEVLTRIYVKNLEENSRAANLQLTIKDLNSTAEGYYDGNLEKTQPNGLTYTPVTGQTEDNTGVIFIMADELKTDEGVYSQFHFMPTSDTLDVPLNMSLDFDIEVSGVPLEYHGLTLTDKVPLCTAGNFAYNPQWNIFNIEDSVLAGTGKYNLYTQVAKRPFTVNLVSYDPSDYTTLIPANTFVAVEMIDAGGYHDVNISCTDPDAAITERVWIELDNQSTTSIDIAQAVTNGLTTTTEDAFYATVRENTAYRMTFLSTNDSNNSLMQTSGSVATNNVVIDNFAQMTTGLTNCDYNSSVSIASQCVNASSGMTGPQTRQCMECLFGHSVNRVCSRDNFAIRPEAFLVSIYDNQESTNASDPILAVPNPGDIAAGYNYRYDVNATSHADEDGVNGYTQSYITASPDHNSTAYWRPLTSLTGCNDITDKNTPVYLINGSAVNNLNRSNNVGRYVLEMRDAAWTKVDQAPEHHTQNPGSFDLNDCAANQSFVPNNASALNSTNVGCTISSNHTNAEAGGTVYTDYDILVHPYDFNLSTFTFNKGMNNTLVVANDYVYMNNVVNDANMSVRYVGSINAVGANTVPLSNFVANCYAENINLDLNTSALPAAPAFTYRLLETNTSNGVVFNDTNGNNGGNTALPPVLIPAQNFLPNSFGVSSISLNTNLTRTVNTAVNPIPLTYGVFDVACTTSANCASYADMSATHLPDSNITSNASVTHIYGRVHTPRQRVANPNPAAVANATIPLYYEFYCDSTTGCVIGNYIATPALSPIGLLSPDDVRWYSQAMHTIAVDGNASATEARSAVDDALITTKVINVGAQSANYTYNGNRGYPYKATIELFAPTWLIYNRFNPGAVVNDFEIEFFSTGQFAGQDQSGVNVDANTSINVNRRIQW